MDGVGPAGEIISGGEENEGAAPVLLVVVVVVVNQNTVMTVVQGIMAGGLPVGAASAPLSSSASSYNARWIQTSGSLPALSMRSSVTPW